jgi:hypothetical protein
MKMKIPEEWEGSAVLFSTFKFNHSDPILKF